MINLEELNNTIVTSDTLMHIINDPYVQAVIPYTGRKGLQRYNVVTMSGERYKVFTLGKIL